MDRTQSDGAATREDRGPAAAGVVLRDGGPADAADLTAMLRLLSPGSAFMRFLAGFGEPKPALVRALLATDARRGAVLAVLPGGTVVGHACWSVGGGQAGAGQDGAASGSVAGTADGVVDVGVVVLDGWQRRGIGRALVGAAVARAAAAGGTSLHLDVHPENRALLASLRRRLPQAVRRFADGLVTFDVRLADAVRDAPPEPDLPRPAVANARRAAVTAGR